MERVVNSYWVEVRDRETGEIVNILAVRDGQIEPAEYKEHMKYMESGKFTRELVPMYEETEECED